MSVATQDTAVSTGRITRTFIYLILLLFALFYLLQSVLGMHPLLAPILVTVLLLPLTYLLSKLVLVGRDPQVRERSERSPPEP